LPRIRAIEHIHESTGFIASVQENIAVVDLWLRCPRSDTTNPTLRNRATVAVLFNPRRLALVSRSCHCSRERKKQRLPGSPRSFHHYAICHTSKTRTPESCPRGSLDWISYVSSRICPSGRNSGVGSCLPSKSTKIEYSRNTRNDLISNARRTTTQALSNSFSHSTNSD